MSQEPEKKPIEGGGIGFHAFEGSPKQPEQKDAEQVAPVIESEEETDGK